MSVFDQARDRVHDATTDLFGEVAEWTPSVAGASQTYPINFRRPDQMDAIGQFDDGQYEFQAQDTVMEYREGQFDGLFDLVGNNTMATESVRITEKISGSLIGVYVITKIERIHDGATYRATLRRNHDPDSSIDRCNCGPGCCWDRPPRCNVSALPTKREDYSRTQNTPDVWVAIQGVKGKPQSSSELNRQELAYTVQVTVRARSLSDDYGVYHLNDLVTAALVGKKAVQGFSQIEFIQSQHEGENNGVVEWNMFFRFNGFLITVDADDTDGDGTPLATYTIDPISP